MTAPTRNRPPTLIVIAVAILFIVLAVVEAMAGQLTPPASGPAAPWMIHIRHIEDVLAKRVRRQRVRPYEPERRRGQRREQPESYPRTDWFVTVHRPNGKE